MKDICIWRQNMDLQVLKEYYGDYTEGMNLDTFPEVHLTWNWQEFALIS